MSSYEYRVALPHVLDDVHRKTIHETLVEYGVTPPDDSWQTLQEAANEYGEAHNNYIGTSTIMYYDGHTFGPVLGQEAHLKYSTVSEGASQLEDSSLANDHRGRVIRLVLEGTDNEASLYLVRDSPPFAISHENIKGAYMSNGDLCEQPNEGRLGEIVAETYGPDAVDYISEEAAAGIITALQQDTTRIY